MIKRMKILAFIIMILFAVTNFNICGEGEKIKDPCDVCNNSNECEESFCFDCHQYCALFEDGIKRCVTGQGVHQCDGVNSIW